MEHEHDRNNVWHLRITDAPRAYDWFGTTECGSTTIEYHREYRVPKVLRRVFIRGRYLDSQTARYLSGMHAVFTEGSLMDALAGTFPDFTTTEQPGVSQC